MDSQSINGQPRKAGVDYGRCQAEFDAQILLLKEDLKKRLRRTQNEHEGRKISDFSWPSSLAGMFIILVIRCLSLRNAVYRSTQQTKGRARTCNVTYPPWQFRLVASVLTVLMNPDDKRAMNLPSD
jgi:hypothetical protein